VPINFDKSPAGSVTLKAPSSGSTTFTLPASDGSNRQLIITNGLGVLSFVSLQASDIPTLTASKISDFDTQVRTSRLDQMAVPTASVNLNSQKIINLATPTNATDAANKDYVDSVSQGLDPKNSVHVATTTNLNLSSPGSTIDGVTMVSGDRVLVKDQSTASQNGIYVWNGAASAMTRATDADSVTKLNGGAFVFVEEGNTYATTGWVLQQPVGTYVLGTTALTWSQFSGAGQITAGPGLTKSGNTISLAIPVAISSGGTGLTAVGSANQFLRVNALGNALEYRSLIASDIPDVSATYVTLAGSQTISGTKTFSANPIFSLLTGYVKANGASALTASSTVPAGDISGTLGVSNGGTGATTLTSNGVLLGNGTSAIQATSAGTANQVLRVPSAGGAPAFGAINLASTSAVTGTLPISNGGTGQTSFASGILKSDGTTLSAGTLSASDIPDLSSTYVTLNTAQTVNGVKTFASGINVSQITPSANNYIGLGASGTPVRQIDTWIGSNNNKHTDVFPYNTSTSATPVDLFLDGSTTRMGLSNGEAWYYEAKVLGTQTGGTSGTVGDSFATRFTGVIKRSSGGTTSMVGSTSQDIDARDAGAANWATTVTADTSNNALKIACTGEANKTIYWQSKVSLVRIGTPGASGGGGGGSGGPSSGMV
jgi:hypothetical protein